MQASLFKLKIYNKILLPSRIPRLLDAWVTKGRRDAVFIWIPKNAGTSLQRALKCPKLLNLREAKMRFLNRGPVTFGHMDYHLLVSRGVVSPKFDRNSYKFSFSRNPYSRAVSLYLYLKGTRFPENWSFGDFCKRLEIGDIEAIGIHNNRGLIQCNPQTRWLENINLDYLGRFETVEIDLARIQTELKLEPVRVPRLNQTLGTSKDYRVFYDERSCRTVADFYDADFRTFGYSKDLNRINQDSIITPRSNTNNHQ